MEKGRFPRRRQRGFTMTELAIVLGIVGVIVAGIWSAAASVQSKAKIHQANEQLGLIATNLQSFYASRNVTYSALGNPGAFVDLTATYAGQNVFPSEMVSGAAVSNPWSGAVLAGLSGTNATTPVNFFIEYQGLSPDGCSAMVANNSMPGREVGLVQIIIKDNGGNPKGTYTAAGFSLPVSVATLAGVCTEANAPLTVDWYYKVGQGCAAGSPC